MLKNILISLIIVSFLVSCGRGPRHISPELPTDQNLSCQQLNAEIGRTQNEIAKMLVELEEIGAKNSGLFVASWFTALATLPFIDVRQGQYKDLEALRERYSHLISVIRAKKCNFVVQDLKEFENHVLDKHLDKMHETYPKNSQQ